MPAEASISLPTPVGPLTDPGFRRDDRGREGMTTVTGFNAVGRNTLRPVMPAAGRHWGLKYPVNSDNKCFTGEAPDPQEAVSAIVWGQSKFQSSVHPAMAASGSGQGRSDMDGH